MNTKNYTSTSSTVCLDAKQVKRIREDQQLTQLYISKVVGVTTDTISRWENNRYPTMRRENALKLADALEVSLEDILQQPASEAEEAVPPARQKKLALWGGLLVLCLVVLSISFSFMSKKPLPPVAVTALRTLQNFASPGSTIPVQITLTHRTKGGGVILKEYFPKGWKIVQAFPPASSLDNINGVARWIIKAADNRDRVVYLLQVDHDAKVNVETTFVGEIVSGTEGNQSSVPVQGESKVSVAPFHWADADGNGTIDDAEMLQASFTIEDMSGVHIDWDDLEGLWDAGRYYWDQDKSAFLPQPK